MRISRLVPAVALAVGLFVFWSRGEPGWKIRNSPAGGGPVVCFGDSLTSGFGADPNESYPEILGSLLRRQVLNRGRSGETSESALERLEGDVLAADPAVVVVTLGGNDMLRRLPVESTLQSLREIFGRLLAAGTMVAFVAVDPPFVSGERMDRVKDLARELGVLYLDSVLDDFWGDPRLMSDRIHPNAAGYRLMAERIHEALAPRMVASGRS